MAPDAGGSFGGGGSGSPADVAASRFDDVDKWESSLPEDQKKAVASWMRNGYKEMRNSDKTGAADEKLDSFKEAIKTAPLYNQPVHRGIRHKLDAKVGDEIDLHAISSFSTNPSVAKSFAVEDVDKGGYIPTSTKVTILSISSHKGAARLPMKSIGGRYETEAVMEKGRKFRVVRVEQTEIKRPGSRGKGPKKWKAQILHLEEV